MPKHFWGADDDWHNCPENWRKDRTVWGIVQRGLRLGPLRKEESNPNSIEVALQRLANGEELLDVLEGPLVEKSDRLDSERENHATKRTSRASSP